eukprot:2599629-Pleurochrysis_carterae.AAC.1
MKWIIVVMMLVCAVSMRRAVASRRPSGRAESKRVRRWARQFRVGCVAADETERRLPRPTRRGARWVGRAGDHKYGGAGVGLEGAENVNEE